jgi:CRISPR-associated endonuclease/helicase Cas3
MIKNNNQLLSHPEKLLIDHIDRGAHLLNNKMDSIELGFTSFDNIKLKQACMLGYLFHDIGKCTSYFQKYIREVDKPNPTKLTRKKNHSQISAFLSYKAISDILNDEVLSALCYSAIMLHHSNVGKLYDILVKDIDHEYLKDLYLSMFVKQDEINFVFNRLLKKFNFEYEIKYDFTEEEFDRLYDNLIVELEDVYYDHIETLGDNVSDSEMENSYVFQLIYSSILYADKSEAIFNEEITQIDFRAGQIKTEYVDRYKETFPKGESIKKQKLNAIRESIYKEALANLSDNSKIDLDRDKILTLTVPTGGGKTLTSLAIAGKVNEITGKHGKIIYSLPFISIIEQNQNEFRKLLEYNNINVNDNINMLSHYYLSDNTFKTNLREDYNNDKSEHLIETWNSNLIVTTFVQLTNTFFSRRNRDMKRLIQIANSVIVLDEVQSFPVKYHKLFAMVVKALSKMLNIHFIFMTATMPYLFEAGEYKELLSKPEQYYKPINRTSLNYDSKEHDVDELVSGDEFIDRYNVNETSFLLVANTIRSSIKLYEYMKERLSSTHKVVYISTNIIPKERKERIDTLKLLLKSGNERVCAVTTQLIEAGVDIDFPMVIRDMSPLDSINQVGGRCNRNGFDEQRPYYVINLNDGDYRTSRIYDSKLVAITKQIIQDRDGFIAEKDFYETASAFFRKVNDEKAQDFTDNFRALCRMDYEDVDFKLIEKSFETAEVFIQVDDDAKEIWDEYIKTVKDFEIKDKKDRLTKRLNYAKIKKKMNRYIISVPMKYGIDLCKVYEDSNFFIIEQNDLYKYYNLDTGFIREERSVEDDIF